MPMIIGSTFEPAQMDRNYIPKQDSGNYRFTLYHTDRGWSFNKAKNEWYPVLNQFVHMPGCNGIPQSGNAAGALAVLARKGYDVMSVGDKRLGKYKNYLQTWPTVNSSGVLGKAWGTIFEAPELSKNGRRVYWHRNDVEYYKFLKFVRDSVIEPMSRPVFNEKIEMVESKISRLARLSENPALKKRYEDAISEKELMIKAYEKQFGKKESKIDWSSLQSGEIVEGDEN
jgi:hypothetical protein